MDGGGSEAEPASSTSPWDRGGSMSQAGVVERSVEVPKAWPKHDDEDSPAPTGATADDRNPRRRLLIAGGLIAVLATGFVVTGALDRSNGDDTATSSTIVDSAAIDPTGEPTTEDVTTPALPDTVEVPAGLAGAAPSEVVGLHPRFGVIEVQFPAGTVRATELPSSTDDARLAVNDGAALVWWPGRSDALLVRDGEWTEIEVSQRIDHVSTAAGFDSFILWSDSLAPAPFAEPLPPPDPIRLAPPGRAASLPWAQASSSAALGPTPPILDAAGGLIESDTSGVFRTDADGASRITNGDLISVGRNHRLIRSCDTNRECSLTLQSDDGPDRTFDDIEIDENARPVRDGGLSPTGDALLVMTPPARADRTLSGSLRWIDLATGTSRTVRVTDTDLAAKWSIDGSGLFFADGTPRWFDRSTGSSTPLDASLDGLRDIAVRLPPSS